MSVAKIAEVFDVEPHTVETQIVPVEPNQSSENTEDADFNFARDNYYELIQQGSAAVHTAMRIAAESENPRAIEVLSGLIKNMADVNKQLVQMSKDKAEVKAVRNGNMGKSQPSIGNVQNAVFVGDSSSLNKLLSEKMKGSI